MGECEQFTGNLRMICEGRSELPLRKVNAYRARWKLPPLYGVDVDPSPAVPLVGPAVRPRRRTERARKKPIAGPRKALSPGQRHRGCGSCSRRKKRKPELDGYGPGSRLMKIMTDAGVPHCQACRDLAAEMDGWGAEGCTQRLDTIITDILPRAREWLSAERPWAHRLLSATHFEDAALRLAIRQKVQQAVKAATGT